MLYFYNVLRLGFAGSTSPEGFVAKSKQSLRAESLATEHLRGVRLLADFASGLASLDDPEDLQEQTLEYALRMFRCSSGAVCPRDSETGRVRLGPAAGQGKGLDPEHLLTQEPVRVSVLRDHRLLVLPEPALTLGASLADGWRGLAVVPIAGPLEVLGFLVLGDLAAGDVFTEADAALMAAFSSVVALALETSLVHSKFRQDMGRRMTEAMAELTRAAAELQRLRTFNEDLFESAPVGIIVFDREFRVTFRNAAAERLWPEDRSVLEAARRTDLGRQDPDWEAGLSDAVNMQKPWLAEEVGLVRPGKEPARLNLSCSPLRSGRRSVVGGVLIVEDVTQRVHMERRLAVSERLAGVGRLAAMVAHEINNPLDGIIRLVNLARRAEAGDLQGDPAADRARVERYLAEVHKGLMRMVMIVRDLLEFSRSASGVVDPMPIGDILTEVVHALAPAAEKGGVAIDIHGDAALPPLKSSSLYQVVLNLAKNAVEASPSGGRVRVSARCEGDALVIEVADCGPGVAPEVLARMFEPFFSLKMNGKGTGLGLVISRDLVEKQGGTISVSNRPEGGALFAVRIPLAPGACDCK
jgi:signal transduction histidine kinase